MIPSRIFCALAVGASIVIAGFLPTQAATQAEKDVPNQSASESKTDDQKDLSPDEKMQARFPQPAKVGHLIGLPVLDGDDSTIGYVQQIFRTPDGKIKLIVPYGERFGWLRDGRWLASKRRPVAVPIEGVTLLALQINAVDMDRSAFANAPTWMPGESMLLPPDETIRIGLGRR